MRGNAKHYQNKTLTKVQELKKLRKVKAKYQRRLRDIMEEILAKEKIMKKDVHCLTLIHADHEESVITE